MKPRRAGKRRRFKSLRNWADWQVEQAKKNGVRQEVVNWRKRRRIYRARARHFRKPDPKPPSPTQTQGVAWFDGKAVAAWIAPVLAQARNQGWAGSLTSGYRSPEYSEQLCYQICGAPSCPGRCAGRSSNHTRLDSGAAVDVSDPAGFARTAAARNAGLFNALGAADPWHMSKSGR